MSINVLIAIILLIFGVTGWILTITVGLPIYYPLAINFCQVLQITFNSTLDPNEDE